MSGVNGRCGGARVGAGRKKWILKLSELIDSRVGDTAWGSSIGNVLERAMSGDLQAFLELRASCVTTGNRLGQPPVAAAPVEEPATDGPYADDDKDAAHLAPKGETVKPLNV